MQTIILSSLYRFALFLIPILDYGQKFHYSSVYGQCLGFSGSYVFFVLCRSKLLNFKSSRCGSESRTHQILHAIAKYASCNELKIIDIAVYAQCQ